MFRQGIKFYDSEKHIYVLELWGASTKHPDSIFYFDEFEKNEYMEDKYQVYQWLLECASKMLWPFHAKQLVDYANENWVNWFDDDKEESEEE